MNNHQLEFAKAMQYRYGNILVVENIGFLKEVVTDCAAIASTPSTGKTDRNIHFLSSFRLLVRELSGDKI